MIGFHKGHFFVKTIAFIWLQFTNYLVTLEPENVRISGYQEGLSGSLGSLIRFLEFYWVWNSPVWKFGI